MNCYLLSRGPAGWIIHIGLCILKGNVLYIFTSHLFAINIHHKFTMASAVLPDKYINLGVEEGRVGYAIFCCIDPKLVKPGFCCPISLSEH